MKRIKYATVSVFVPHPKINLAPGRIVRFLLQSIKSSEDPNYTYSRARSGKFSSLASCERETWPSVSISDSSPFPSLPFPSLLLLSPNQRTTLIPTEGGVVIQRALRPSASLPQLRPVRQLQSQFREILSPVASRLAHVRRQDLGCYVTTHFAVISRP